MYNMSDKRQRTKELESGLCFFPYNIKHIFYLGTLYLKCTSILENSLYLHSFYIFQSGLMYVILFYPNNTMVSSRDVWDEET